ncbi:unnamed protein product [Linum trigynum]|uniref:Uncharacterized protein n=1 Tax=Linum trigynum TaxID=586398 RepID=A0AAV2G925_9ROSI
MIPKAHLDGAETRSNSDDEKSTSDGGYDSEDYGNDLSRSESKCSDEDEPELDRGYKKGDIGEANGSAFCDSRLMRREDEEQMKTSTSSPRCQTRRRHHHRETRRRWSFVFD